MTDKVECIGKVTFCKDDLIGEGRYGSVFKGKYGSVPEVAVKRVKKGNTKLDPKSFPRVTDPTLLNANIIRFFGTEEDKLGNLFIVTELCVGTLMDLATGKYTGMKIGSDREILLQITQGLAFLHKLNICHGDLKPSNILISKPQGSEKPQMKLCDFSLLHKDDGTFDFFDDKKFRPAFTEGWSVPGSTLDFAFDIFSLGLCFTYFLTRGLHAFGAEIAIRNLLMKKKNCAMVVTPADFERHEAGSAFGIVEKMLRSDAKRRPTVTEILTSFYLKGPSEKPKIATPIDEPQVTAKPSKRVQDNKKVQSSSAKRVKKESSERSHSTPKRQEHSSLSSKVSSTHSSEKIKKEYSSSMEKKKKARMEVDNQASVDEGTPSTSQHESSEDGLVAASKAKNSDIEVSLAVVDMLSPPKTATPFDNGLDGRDASQDIDSSFNFPEIPLGSEPSSKDENPDENVEVVDSDDSLPEVEVARPIKKSPRKSARLANASMAQSRTPVLIQEENQQQTPVRKISILTPPPDCKSESNFPLPSVQNENEGFEGQKSFPVSSGGSEQVLQPITNGIRQTNLSNKETELLNLCTQWSLDEMAIERLRVLSSDKHVNVNCLDLYDRTPLLLICMKNRSESLLRALEVLLLRDSVSVNARDREGFSALALVCLHDGGLMMIKVIQLLIRYGADIHALSNQNWSVLYALFSNFNGRVHKLLDITKTLLSSGIEINMKAKDGSNALIALCSDYSHRSSSDFVAVLRLLIEKNVDLNATDASFRSVLHILCAEYTGSNLLEIVQLLVQAGIKLDLKDDDNKTAYDIMIELASFPIDSEIVQLLKIT